MSYNSKYTGKQVESYIDKVALGELATTSALNDKVDKVSGKQLSTEDFTTALKTKLEGLNNYDDTEIESAITSLQTQFNTLVSGNASDAINSFNEIIAFLNGIEDSESLDSIIASIEQQIAGKQDKLISGTNIKTINGTSILGSGDIEISGGEDIVVKELSETYTLVFDTYSGVLEPNKIYVVREKVNESIFISPNAVIAPTSDMGKYSILFTTADDGAGIIVSLPDTWLWANGTIPEIETNVSYELSIVATKLEDDYIYKAVLTPFKSV